MTYFPTSREDYNVQGKSNSYLAAHSQGRLTAGEAAKYLSKKLGEKLLARQIEPLATEFHHAGRFGGDKAKRVFFFTVEQLDRLTIEDVRAAYAPKYGWILGFRAERGRYGKKSYVPVVAEVGLIDAARANRLGDKFHPLDENEVQEAKVAVGKRLPVFANDWRLAE